MRQRVLQACTCEDCAAPPPCHAVAPQPTAARHLECNPCRHPLECSQHHHHGLLTSAEAVAAWPSGEVAGQARYLEETSPRWATCRNTHVRVHW